MLLFLALVGQLTYLQLVRANDLKNDPRNVRVLIRDFSRPRGPIVTADGEVVAESVPSNDDLKQQRAYPLGSLFAHVTGYQSIVYGTTGVERIYNDELVGRDLNSNLRGLNSCSRRGPHRHRRASASQAAQQAARDALAGATRLGRRARRAYRRGRRDVLGAVVRPEPARQPRHASNVETSPEGAPRRPEQPRTRARVARALPGRVDVQGRHRRARARRPASRPPERSVPAPHRAPAPADEAHARELRRRDAAAATLDESFTVSCNTTFGRLGLDLGDQLADGIEHFGINTPPPPTDVNPKRRASVGPGGGTFKDNQPLFAQAAIGQADVAVTPLEMAMIAAVGREQRDDDGAARRERGPRRARTARCAVSSRRCGARRCDPTTAATLTRFMVDVVATGTGTAAQIPGVQVAGKTGTAEVRGQGTARVVHRVRAGRQPRVRGRGARRERRRPGQRGDRRPGRRADRRRDAARAPRS